ncbi:hypothetical protein BDZ89DRAFT_945754 [Hymenopellis radicata]|nr:hypothetical protein BDZ89DRAFT_945754 [Hymenopellis radicata]
MLLIESPSYHMQYAHGISAATNRPFDPPVKTRIGPPSPKGINLKPEHEKLYGLCGRCDMWVPVEGLKDAPVKVPEMVWWKHARGCGARG